ncbi:MAG: amidohydrolase family protein [Armatimonadaceae bacterium]
MELIDCHQHLWDLTRFDLPWVRGLGLPLEAQHTPTEYQDAISGTPIGRRVYMEVDVTPEQRVLEAAYACDLGPAVVGADPASQTFSKHLDEISDPNLKGVRQVLHGGHPEARIIESRFIQNLELLGERNLSFDICIRPGELAHAAMAARRVPGTTFILDHCGNGDVQATESERAKWMKGIETVAAEPNVWCKISGIIVTAKRGAWSADDLAPIINHCLEAFGPDRVIFGSDWPVCTLTDSLKAWVDAFTQITGTLSESNREKLWFRNAERLYSLAPSE